MATKKTVDTTTYTFNHGAKPRGRGYWLFAIDGNENVLELFGHNGTFSEALKAARAVATHNIKVMP